MWVKIEYLFNLKFCNKSIQSNLQHKIDYKRKFADFYVYKMETTYTGIASS